MNNLIINNIDHSQFDLSWVKIGGVAYGKTKAGNRALWTYFQGHFLFLAYMPIGKNEWLRPIGYMMVGSKFNDTYTKIADRMATPQECLDAGVEYIEPPMVWRPIETAPESTYTWPWCQDDKPDKLSERDWEYYEIKASRIIACDSDGFVTEAYNWFGKWYYIFFSGEFHEPTEIKPVKWIPLPPAPKDE